MTPPLHPTWTVRSLAVGALLAAAAVVPPAHAQRYLPITDPLPAVSGSSQQYQSGYNRDCAPESTADTYACVHQIIDEMQRRYDALHGSCDHRGLFALAYLETTREYQRAVHEPGFFREPEVVNHEDDVFAQLYFDHQDAYDRGDRASVPAAWLLAFDAAKAKSQTTMGDVMLGISAHINRDLPIALATIGLRDPKTGRSRKPDHDKVNAFLARVNFNPQVRAAWDPSYSSTDAIASFTAEELTLIQAWREAAFREAERLIEAKTAAQQALVLREIEQSAWLQGRLLILSTRNAPGTTSAERDAYCAAHQ